MAIKKVQIMPPNYTDILHPETDSDMVLVGNETLTERLNSVGSLVLDVNNINWTGVTKEVDTLTEKGSSIYKNTVTSGAVSLGGIITTKLILGSYGVCLRLKSANNTLTTDSIRIEIQKNVAGTFTTQKTLTLKATDFENTTDYKCFYTRFDYKGGKAQNNEIRILITLLTQSSAYKVSLDYIQISPLTVGVFE